jgi:glycosyltransferase involved in cell wall biosynthesis
MRGRRLLFVTWDGPQVTYLEGLFLPILAGLAPHVPHVLQFTWGAEAGLDERRALCAARGVPYRAVRIWRRGGALGPLASALLGRRHIARAVRDWKIDTLMPRSLMPALASLALPAGPRGGAGLRIVFDADGLPADERVEFAGLPPTGATYRLLRDIEAQAVRRADHVLVRTEAARDILIARAGPPVGPERFTVVPNGRDPAPYARSIEDRARRDAAGGTRPFTLCYAGSVGPQYLPGLMLEAARRIRVRIPRTRLRILTGDNENLRAALAASGIEDRSWIEIGQLPAEKIPQALAEADLGLAFRNPSFSMRAVAPIKVGEYLLAGLPVLGSPGIGAADALTEAGVHFPCGAADLDRAVAWVAKTVRSDRAELRARCHAAGRRHFSLEASVARYRDALASLPPEEAMQTWQGVERA